MQEFRYVPFQSNIEISLTVWYQMKEEKMLLIMKFTVCFNDVLLGREDISLIYTGFLFI